MKYKATEKNEYLCSGTEFEFKESSYVVAHYYDGCRADQELKNDWIENGWCEEIQEPEFTLNQLKERAVAFACYMVDVVHDLDSVTEVSRKFDEWAKDKGI